MQVISIVLIATISAMPYDNSIWSSNSDLPLANYNQFNSPALNNANDVHFFEGNSGQVQNTPSSFSGFSEPSFNNLKSESQVDPMIAVDPVPLPSWESSFNESESPLDGSSGITQFANESPNTFNSDSFIPSDSTSQSANEWDYNRDNIALPNDSNEVQQASPFSTWNSSPENTQQLGNDGGFKASKQFQSEQGQEQLGFYNINLE
jgi:hypothetical protein